MLSAPATAADTPALPTRHEVEALIAQGQAWMLSQHQDSGALMPGNQFSLGVTAMAATTLASPPLAVPGSDRRIGAALDWLLTFRQKDGGFYRPDEGLGAYGTAFTLMALSAAGRSDTAAIGGAQGYLFAIQNKDPANVCIGGIGYGPEEGPGKEDLHNTSVAVAALRASGVPASDPRLQLALRFAESCQNRSPAVRAPGGIDDPPRIERPWVNGDGGGVYSPTESKAGGDWNPAAPPSAQPPRLTSYASITHALIETYLTLDVPADDPRVQAAVGWLTGNYRLDVNAGMPDAQRLDGLFYAYAASAKTFALLGMKRLTLADGRATDWRADLFAAIRAQARTVKLADGSVGAYWVNASNRWGEALPHLATAYLVQALKHLHRAL